MATWDADADITHAVDFRLVQNTFVTMFWSSSLLDENVDWLRSHGYDVVEFDASSWTDEAAALADIANGLGFPNYFGRNLDALNDCMSDVGAGDYGWDAKGTGLVIVLTGFDHFATVDRRVAQAMLDIFADQARGALLVGNRIICLVQSDDPRLTFEPVGAMPVLWNDAGWGNSKRGL